MVGSEEGSHCRAEEGGRGSDKKREGVGDWGGVSGVQPPSHHE